MATAFLIPALLWALVKPLLTNATKSQRERDELLRIKRNPKLFQSLLLQEPRMPTVPNDLCPILLGNPEAEHMITMVTNPYCRPCATAHKELNDLLSRNSEVNAAIVFACDGADGRATQVALHAMALAQQDSAAVALTNWYGQPEKNYATWVDRYPASSEKTDFIPVAERHRQWCHIAGVTGTPTVYVDGYKLPKVYRLDDLRWLITKLEPTTPIHY